MEENASKIAKNSLTENVNDYPIDHIIAVDWDWDWFPKAVGAPGGKGGLR